MPAVARRSQQKTREQWTNYVAPGPVKQPVLPVLPAKIALSPAMKVSLGKAVDAGHLSGIDLPDFVQSPLSNEMKGYIPINFVAEEPAFVSTLSNFAPPPGLQPYNPKEENESDGGSTDDIGSVSMTSAESWLGDVQSDMSSVPVNSYFAPCPVSSYQSLAAAISLCQQHQQLSFQNACVPDSKACADAEQVASVEEDVHIPGRRPCKKKRRNCVKIIEYLLCAYQKDEDTMSKIASKLASESTYMRCLCLKHMIPVLPEEDIEDVVVPQHIQDLWTQVSPGSEQRKLQDTES